MAAFERGAHHLGVAGRVETVFGATVGQFDHLRDRLLARQALRIEEMRHPELSAPCLAVGVDVDADHPPPAHPLRALDDVAPYPAPPQHADILVCLHPFGVDHPPDPGCAAAEIHNPSFAERGRTSLSIARYA